MGDEGKRRDGDDRLQWRSAELPDSEEEGGVGDGVVERADQLCPALDRDDLSPRNRRKKPPHHRGLYEGPDEKEDEFVDDGDADKEGHVGMLCRLGDRLPVDREAEDVDQRASRYHEGEDMTKEEILRTRHGAAA